MGQLTEFTRSDGIAESYTYDPAGNMLSKTAGGIKTNYTYNAGNQLVGDGTYKYTYDKIGNLVEKAGNGGQVSYTYNALNLLEKWTDGENTETYTYNAAGLLSTVNTNTSTTTLTWDILYGDGVVISANENGTVTDYTYGLERISASSGRARTEYVYDGRGSVIGEVTKAGLLSKAKVTTKSYTPFGEQIGEKTSGFGWNGEYYNAATGQVYLRARFYEPEMNRFGQKDIVRGTTASALTQNRYLFCYNDPVNYIDPSGQIGLLAGTAIAAGICGLVAGATSAYQSYKSTGKVDWKQAGKAAVGGVTAAVAVGVAVATGGTGLGVATMVVEAVAGGRTALRGGNAADVTTSMAKAGATAVIAGNVLPGLPNAAKAVIGTVGTVGGVVKTVKDAKAASNTFKDSNATTLDKVNAAVDVALDVAGTIGSAAYAYSGVNGMIADAKTVGAASRPAVASPQNADNPYKCDAGSSPEAASSYKLRKNMNAAGIETPEYDNAAHHIVAGGSPKAEVARTILEKFGIGINDAENGVFLPTEKGVADAAYHPSLHTNDYYDTVNSMLEKATSREDAIEILQAIAEELQNGTFMK